MANKDIYKVANLHLTNNFRNSFAPPTAVPNDVIRSVLVYRQPYVCGEDVSVRKDCVASSNVMIFLLC